MELVFGEAAQTWFELILLWTGFGTCVGLVAKALMPGRDPGGPVATLLMGITGVIIGCGVYTLVYDERLSPVTSIGMVCGTMGALVILVFYRVLGGFLLDEPAVRRGGGPAKLRRSAGMRRRRRRHSYYLDE
jgi:uncharacterized membrane protein YeaQ/YmgE (transglycosylase-associated protein family)